MSLTKEQRDALPDSDFAVPETRDLPIHDKTHTKMAWSMVDKTKGLNEEQRKEAKKRILKRAHEQGINTDDWNVTAINAAFQKVTINFEAMAIKLPDDKEHPNKVPFSGILTRIDEPSDAPVGGAGHKIIIPKAVAEKALDSLACMAVDFKPDFDGHDARRKIGIITEAHIVGNAIEIKGFFYGADFPNEVKRIQAEKDLLGFSYEAQAQVGSMDDDIWTISNCIFTGAAVLYKDKAAYQSTALAASKVENEEMSKTNDDILNILKEMKEDNASIKKEIAELKANAEKLDNAKKVEAAGLTALVTPHAEALRNCAASMCAAGIGTAPNSGHGAALHRMADHMMAEAASGRMPHVYQTPDFFNAEREKEEEEKKEDPEITRLKKELEASLANLKTHNEDLKKQKFEAEKEPERKTLSAGDAGILKKIGLSASQDNQISIPELDKALAGSNFNVSQKIALKTRLSACGLISN